MPEDKQFKEYIAETTKGENDGELTAVISTSVVDREKEVMLPKGADTENFMKNPVVLWAHDYHNPPIGRAMWIKTGRNQLTAGMEFAQTEQAQEAYELYKGGFLKAFSVGFLTKKSHEPTPKEVQSHPEWAEARRIIDEWELLEFSAVPVPANQQALATAVKSGEISISKGLQDKLGIEEEKGELEVAKEVEVPAEAEQEIIVVPVHRILPVKRVVRLRQGVIPHQVLDPARIARRSISIIKGKVYE